MGRKMVKHTKKKENVKILWRSVCILYTRAKKLRKLSESYYRREAEKNRKGFEIFDL